MSLILAKYPKRFSEACFLRCRAAMRGWGSVVGWLWIVVLCLSGALVGAGCTTDAGDPPPSGASAGQQGGEPEDGENQTTGATDSGRDTEQRRNERMMASIDAGARCFPRQCDGDCGVIDDGCGGTISCGPCTCTPRTCEDMNATCGTIDDGCGETIDCESTPCEGTCEDNRCSCAGDSSEANDAHTDAVELGPLDDYDDPAYDVTGLNLHHDQDEDWFTGPVTDEWDLELGNPIIHVRLTAPSGGDHQVTIYYFCDAGSDFDHTCMQSSTYSDSFGRGCQGSSQMALRTDCPGSNEDGRVYIQVTPGESATTCQPYDLRVQAI